MRHTAISIKAQKENKNSDISIGDSKMKWKNVKERNIEDNYQILFEVFPRKNHVLWEKQYSKLYKWNKCTS